MHTFGRVFYGLRFGFVFIFVVVAVAAFPHAETTLRSEWPPGRMRNAAAQLHFAFPVWHVANPLEFVHSRAAIAGDI